VEIHTQHGHTAISEASQIGVLSAGGGGGGSLGGGGEIIEPSSAVCNRRDAKWAFGADQYYEYWW
jgi:hypothetical protein